MFESFLVFIVIVYHKLRQPFLQLRELVLVRCLVLQLHIQHMSMRSTCPQWFGSSPVLKCAAICSRSQKAIRFRHQFLKALLLLLIDNYLIWKVSSLAHSREISLDFARHLKYLAFLIQIESFCSSSVQIRMTAMSSSIMALHLLRVLVEDVPVFGFDTFTTRDALAMVLV